MRGVTHCWRSVGGTTSQHPDLGKWQLGLENNLEWKWFSQEKIEGTAQKQISRPSNMCKGNRCERMKANAYQQRLTGSTNNYNSIQFFLSKTLNTILSFSLHAHSKQVYNGLTGTCTDQQFSHFRQTPNLQPVQNLRGPDTSISRSSYFQSILLLLLRQQMTSQSLSDALRPTFNLGGQGQP